MKKNKTCPCFSGQMYSECCQPYHEGAVPKTAEALMRSRFSAYSLGLADYIIRTTHPDSTTYNVDKKAWKESILQFHREGTLKNLEILDCQQYDDIAFVIFIITISLGETIGVYTEKSCFLKEDGKWLFQDSLINEGRATVKEMNEI